MKKIKIFNKKSILTGFLIIVIAFVLLTIALTPTHDDRRPTFDAHFRSIAAETVAPAILCCDTTNASLQGGDSAAIQAGLKLCSDTLHPENASTYDNNLGNVIVSSNCDSKKWELIITPRPEQIGRCTKAVCSELGYKYTKADGTAC